MWLWLSLTTLLCWSGSDLFSKIGCRDGSDKYSHLKMVIAGKCRTGTGGDRGLSKRGAGIG